MLVEPGDYVLTDRDGVLIVPQTLAEHVAAAGAEMNARDDFSQCLLAAGERLDRAYPIPPERKAEFERFRRGGE